MYIITCSTLQTTWNVITLFSFNHLLYSSLRLQAHIRTSGKQSWQDVQALHAADGRGATDPLQSCSAPHGALCRMASPVESHWTETAADRGLPATRLRKSDLAMSPTAARPERLRG